MLSKHMTSSLMILITIFALAFMASTAMGAVLGDGFKTTLSLINNADATPALVTDNTLEGAGEVTIKVVFDKEVTLAPADPTPDGTEAGFSLLDIKVTKAKDQSDRDVTVTPTSLTVFTGSANMKDYQFSLGTITPTALSADGTGTGIITVEVKVLKNRVKNNNVDDRVQTMQKPGDVLGYNSEGALTFTVAPAQTNRPTVTLDTTSIPAILLGPTVHPSFSFKVTLSEKPAGFGKDHVDVKNGTVDSVVKIDDTNYVVVVMPKYESKDKIEIRIKPFERNQFPRISSLLTGKTLVSVNSDANKKIGLSGTEVILDKDFIIPAGGYLVVARNKAMSYITDPGDPKQEAADILRRTEAKHQSYNLIEKSLGKNLEGFLVRGGTIDLVSPSAGLVITEIMWATDGGSQDRQWIEIANTTDEAIKLGDKTTKFMIYESNEVLPDPAVAANKIVDRVSTLYKGTNHWSVAGKGQSGRSSDIVTLPQQDFEVIPTSPLVSMERAMMADGMYADGTMAGSWGSSRPPSQNFMDAAGALFVGSPGASPINPVADPMPEPEPEVVPPAAVATATDIMITEIMVDTGSGRLPQWIELTNVSGAEKSLAGWSVEISNNATDDDAIGTSISISLSGTLGVGGGEDAGGTMGKSLLLVAGMARSSSNLAGSDRVVDISAAVDQKGRYTLLSTIGFMITLLPPQTTGIVQYGDTAGNLDGGWDLPMSENGRSSLIRREELDDGMATMGTDANGWILASSTSLVSGPATWYGSDEDAGTPGYDAGGPLPVELSHFRPARDKATGAVVITWATQSELNNAGFFIKRSQQRNGQFKVINATMVAGAGTTSEKQSYTYTDTTAQPNVVYYYQIEDVSLDGNRQTLTNGIRLKGHIGAAGKATTTWGDLKTSHE